MSPWFLMYITLYPLFREISSLKKKENPLFPLLLSVSAVAITLEVLIHRFIQPVVDRGHCFAAIMELTLVSSTISRFPDIFSREAVDSNCCLSKMCSLLPKVHVCISEIILHLNNFPLI